MLVSGIWSLLGSTTAGVTAYQDTRATAGPARRYYRVWAVNAYGPGGPGVCGRAGRRPARAAS